MGRGIKGGVWGCMGIEKGGERISKGGVHEVYGDLKRGMDEYQKGWTKILTLKLLVVLVQTSETPRLVHCIDFL